MLYFAYGSNMNWNQMRERCRSARFEFVAKAECYHLAFTRFSKKRQCGVADLVESPGSEVWGAVFAIPSNEFGELDKSEGYCRRRHQGKNAYERRRFEVLRQGDNASRITVWTYFVVNKLKSPPRPSAEYKETLLNGARHWRLPAHHIDELERIDSSATPA
jgi:gamma-glutamylcyclotransferase